MRVRVAFVLALVACVGACADPVRDHSVDELGGEQPGVPAGPLHRPGQPCLVCHGGDGPASSVFALAGTLYQRPTGAMPLHDAEVHFIDSTGEQHTVTSNCAGNFWVSGDSYRPSWPVWVKIELGGQSVEMTSATFREGSCGACHRGAAGPSAAAPVYFADQSASFSQGACP